MTRLKKSLAMLLAFAMIFSTMSVAASAWKADSTSDNDVRFTVEFFRKDANGNWVDAKGRVAPGDEVQARVYLETTFLAAGYNSALFFDTTYFTQNIGSSDPAKDLYPTVNTESAFYRNLELTGSTGWRSDETLLTQNRGNKLLNYMIENNFADEDYVKYDSESGKYYNAGSVDKEYFAYTDIVTAAIYNGSYVYPEILPELDHNADGSIADSSKGEWLYAIELKVNNDGRAVVVDEEGKGGYAKVPALYNKMSETPKGYRDDTGKLASINMFVDIEKPVLDASGNVTEKYLMSQWDADPEFDTKAGYVSTTSYINFDPNGGYFPSDKSEKTRPYAGIIKTTASNIEVPQKDGAVFGGWELVEGADDTMTFDYADKTFKAIWNEPDPVDTTYTVRYWEMDVNGAYTAPKSTVEKSTTAGETITAEVPDPATGFYFDTEKSVLSKIADENSLNNVLDVYYARNEYTVKYVYTDNGGKNAQTETVYYGANLPAFNDLVDGKVPEAKGKDFTGWSATEGGAVLENLPATVESDLTFYAQYENEVYTYTFFAGAVESPEDGEFTDGSKIITLEFAYGTDPAVVAADIEKYVGEPKKAGAEFIGWDGLNTTPTQDLSIYAEYSANEYEVRFFDKNGNIIENTNAEDLIFFYGETVEAGKHIPEGYKSVNSWTINSTTTVAEFPYEVTENVDFYAIESANVYDAIFTINGELYKAVPTIYLEQIIVPDYEVPAGYEFSGWDADIASNGDVMDNVNGKVYDATLVAKDITVTFVIEGQEDTVITGKYGDAITGIPAIPAKEGYEAGTWNPMAPATFPAEDSTYTAKWTPATNTLTFVDVVDGVESTLGTKTAKTNAAIEAQPDPVKTGYTFTGWLCEDGTIIEEAPTVMPTKSQKYIAQWSINEYSYSFDANGGKFGYGTANAGKLDYGTEVAIPSVSLEGYEFAGWANADVENPTAADVVIPKGTDSFVLTEDVAYKAVWTKNVNTVTYDAGEGLITKDDGTRTSKVEFNVAYGDKIPSVNAPARDGYTFKGWTEKTDGVAVPESMPNKSLYFVANWEKNPDPITDVTYKIYSVTQIPGSEEYSAPNLVKTGAALPGTVVEVVEGTAGDNQYKFSDLVPQKSQVLDTTKATSMTLTKDGANELIIYSNLAEFTVTFNAGDGSWDGEKVMTDSGKFGYEIEAPAAPALEGYTFIGWEGYTEGDTFAEDKAYTAKWEIQKHNANFVVVDEAGNEILSETVELEYGEAIILPVITLPEGYEYVEGEGWNIPAGATMGEEDVTYTATIKPVDYTIIYVITNSEIAAAPTAQTFNAGDSVTLKAPATVEGYNFIGWKAADGAVYAPGYVFENIAAGDITLEGSYEPKEFKLIYDTNGADFIAPESVKVGTPVTELPEIPDDPDDDKLPIGWFNGDEPVTLPFDMPAEDLVLTAKFSYKVSYEYTGEVPEGAPVVPATRYYEAGETVDIEAAPTLDGYTFNGWNIDGAPAAAFVMQEKGVKITGSWTSNAPNEFTVTYNYMGDVPAGAPAAPAPATVVEGDTVTPVVPEFEGYTFNGWFDEAGNLVTSFTADKNVTLTGYWTKNDPTAYTVSFKYMGVAPEDAPAVPESFLATVGSTVELSAPELEGYTFDGWYYEGDLVDEFAMPAKDVVITGKWIKNAQDTFAVTYAYTGDVPAGAPAVPAASTAKVGDTVAVAEVPSLEGYIFSGWYFDGEVATSFVMPANDVVITGNWREAPVVIEKYALTLDPNGGTLKGSAEVFVEEYEEGTEIPPVVDPERNGYRFLRWVDEDGNTQVIPKVMPGNDVKLTAEWETLYNVTYLNEDGSVYEVIVSAGAAGENIPAPTSGDPSKDGYNFIKWVDATTGETVTTIPVGGVSLKPVFEEIIPDTYKLSYEYIGTVPAGAPAVPETVYIEEGAVVFLAETPSLEGYTFGGWYYDGKTTESFIMPANAVVIKGEWTANEYSITLDANTGLFDNGASQFIESVEFGANLSDVIPAAPEKEGYTFDGWVDADGNEVEIPATMPAEDIEAFAKWEINTYTITFNSYGGSEVAPVTLEYGAEIKDLPESTKEGFIFVGWTDIDGNALPATMPANDIIAYAKWEAEAETPVYNLTIDAGEGKFDDGKDSHNFEVAEGESLEDYLAEKPFKDGYDFIGWFDEDGNKIDEETATMPGEELTVTAKWEKVKYTITYYLASGESVKVYTTEQFAAGEEIVHPADPTLEGFTFVGWYDEDGNELPAVMGEEDLEAFAKFDINTYKVTYMANGSVYAEYDVVYQAEVPVPADPDSADPALVFAGWRPSVEAVMPAYDLVYTADFVSLESEKYIAKFIVDGKTVDIQVLAEGEEIVMPENPEKFGFKFVGWKPNVPAYMPAEDMEFVAQWEVDECFITIAVGGAVVAGGIIAGSIIGSNAAWITGVSIVGGILVVVGAVHLAKNTHTVTYLVDGETYKTYLVVEGTKIPVPADPTKDGFKFDGWNPEVPEKMDETDLVFEATWSEADGNISGADDTDVNVAIPDTGSVAGGLAAFAVISGAAAAAYVFVRKNKED